MGFFFLLCKCHDTFCRSWILCLVVWRVLYHQIYVLESNIYSYILFNYSFLNHFYKIRAELPQHCDRECVFQFHHYCDCFSLLIDCLFRWMLKLDTTFTKYVLPLPNTEVIYITVEIPVHTFQDHVFPSAHSFSQRGHFQMN